MLLFRWKSVKDAEIKMKATADTGWLCWCIVLQMTGNKSLNRMWNPTHYKAIKILIFLLILLSLLSRLKRQKFEFHLSGHVEPVRNTSRHPITWRTCVVQSLGAFDGMTDAPNLRSRLVPLAGEMMENRPTHRWGLLLIKADAAASEQRQKWQKTKWSEISLFDSRLSLLQTFTMHFGLFSFGSSSTGLGSGCTFWLIGC